MDILTTGQQAQPTGATQGVFHGGGQQPPLTRALPGVHQHGEAGPHVPDAATANATPQGGGQNV